MSKVSKLRGLYVITDDSLTPDFTIYDQVQESLKGGASIVQLRDKSSSDEEVMQKAQKLQQLCHSYGALFVLNDKVEMAIELGCDGLHIGKSDHHRFDQIRREYKGILGVSCYGDMEMAKEFEKKGSDYVAFGSFFSSPTKPNSNIVPLETLSRAKDLLRIPVCAIGGINTTNIQEIKKQNPDMVSLINDIWSSEDILSRSRFYAEQF